MPAKIRNELLAFIGFRAIQCFSLTAGLRGGPSWRHAAGSAAKAPFWWNLHMKTARNDISKWRIDKYFAAERYTVEIFAMPMRIAIVTFKHRQIKRHRAILYHHGLLSPERNYRSIEITMHRQRLCMPCKYKTRRRENKTRSFFITGRHEAGRYCRNAASASISV